MRELHYLAFDDFARQAENDGNIQASEILRELGKAIESEASYPEILEAMRMLQAGEIRVKERDLADDEWDKIAPDGISVEQELTACDHEDGPIFILREYDSIIKEGESLDVKRAILGIDEDEFMYRWGTIGESINHIMQKYFPGWAFYLRSGGSPEGIDGFNLDEYTVEDAREEFGGLFDVINIGGVCKMVIYPEEGTVEFHYPCE